MAFCKVLTKSKKGENKTGKNNKNITNITQTQIIKDNRGNVSQLTLWSLCNSDTKKAEDIARKEKL